MAMIMCSVPSSLCPRCWGSAGYTKNLLLPPPLLFFLLFQHPLFVVQADLDLAVVAQAGFLNSPSSCSIFLSTGAVIGLKSAAEGWQNHPPAHGLSVLCPQQYKHEED